MGLMASTSRIYYWDNLNYLARSYTGNFQGMEDSKLSGQENGRLFAKILFGVKDRIQMQ